MARITNFSPGRRWRCIREDGPSFDFVIVSPGDAPRSVMCRIELIDPGYAPSTKAFSYKHSHLKKHATLLPLSLDVIVAEMVKEE